VRPDLDVAATLECEPELLPYLPALLQDFDELGTDPQRLIACLEAGGVADAIHRGLDLCCGKGAASIALAECFQISIDGIDAMAAFLDSARETAAARGVSELCHFTIGDLCDAVSQPGNYDLVIFGSVGPILGGITHTVVHLMTPLRRGGWILMDDSVMLPGAPTRPGFEAHAELDETRARIELAGAEVIAVHVADIDATENEYELQLIAARGAALVERRPQLSALVERYIARQRAECAFLERWTRDATWLLQKPPD
jgi:SAM-dependent methyltransferase